MKWYQSFRFQTSRGQWMDTSSHRTLHSALSIQVHWRNKPCIPGEKRKIQNEGQLWQRGGTCALWDLSPCSHSDAFWVLSLPSSLISSHCCLLFSKCENFLPRAFLLCWWASVGHAPSMRWNPSPSHPLKAGQTQLSLASIFNSRWSEWFPSLCPQRTSYWLLGIITANLAFYLLPVRHCGKCFANNNPHEQPCEKHSVLQMGKLKPERVK